MGTSTELTAGDHTRMFCYRVNREQHTSWIWKTATQSPSGPHSNSCKAYYELSDRAVCKRSETNTIHLLRRTQQATGQRMGRYQQRSSVKPAYAVTFIKQSPVLKDHIFLVLS
jgi:hypothetical protein